MHPDFYSGEVLLINKPYTWSSFQAVNKMKWALITKMGLPKKFKIGHAGTLDPLATGLLLKVLYKDILDKIIKMLKNPTKTFFIIS